MPFSRSWLVSAVTRPYLSVPAPTVNVLKSPSRATLLTRLMVPPTEPAPDIAELAPLISSIESRLKLSVRVYCALSRTPSVVMSLLAVKPRRLMLSPYPPPPSPAPKVMPGSVLSTSRRPSRFCCAMTSLVTTVMVCGVSTSASVYLGELAFCTRSPCTSTVSSSLACMAASVGASPVGAAMAGAVMAKSRAAFNGDGRKVIGILVCLSG